MIQGTYCPVVPAPAAASFLRLSRCCCHVAGGRCFSVETGNKLGAEVWIIECVASDETVGQRLVRRVESGEITASDARFELFQQQKREWQPVREVEEERHITVDTSGSKEDLVKALLHSMFAKMLRCPIERDRAHACDRCLRTYTNEELPSCLGIQTFLQH